MATSSFDKTFVVTNPEAQKLLLSNDVPSVPLNSTINIHEELDRGDELLKQFFSHSEH